MLPLAEPGMVAVHALVPAADVWRLLPRLEAAGASSILLVPVERMLAMSERRDRSSTTSASAATRRSPSGRSRFDGVEPARAEPDGEVPEDAVLALADAVRRWHELQRPADVALEVAPGVVLERRWVPLPSVGIYVPRGLVSTLVMCAVPAQVAGVERIVVVTPPDGAGTRRRAPRELLGIDEVWALGGPQAIAALAYGTESIRGRQDRRARGTRT